MIFDFNDCISENSLHDKKEELSGKTGSMVHVMNHILQSFTPIIQASYCYQNSLGRFPLLHLVVEKLEYFFYFYIC